MSTGTRDSKATGFLQKYFILILVIGIIVGIFGSFIYEFNQQDLGFMQYLPIWFENHTLVVIAASVGIIVGVLMAFRYAVGMQIVANALGIWGTITGLFFTIVATFMMLRLDDKTLNEALRNPFDSYIIGTLVFAIGFGGLMWFLIRATVKSKRPGVAKPDAVFFAIFFMFFMGLIVTGFLSRSFGAASTMLANEMNPIYQLFGETPETGLAIFAFLFSPLAGLYVIGFFLPLFIMPIVLFAIDDVVSTGSVDDALMGKKVQSSWALKNRKRIKTRKQRRDLKLKRRER